MRDAMTVGQLLYRLKIMCAEDRYACDKIVAIPIQESSIGAIASVKVNSVGIGIDHDGGTVFLYPTFNIKRAKELKCPTVK